MAKKLIAYRIHARARQRIVPGQQRRPWMDETRHRFAYRCLPLTIANAIGWEILLPAKVIAEWNGGNEISDITVVTDDPVLRPEHLALSHFGHGILTFRSTIFSAPIQALPCGPEACPTRPRMGSCPSTA